MPRSFYAALADGVLVLHVVFVAFVVAGLILTWIGYARGWRWVRTRTFRHLHLAAMAIVVAETVVGITCPLTDWEHELRIAAGQPGYERSFLAAWLEWLLYYEAPEWIFLLIYALFFFAMILTYCLLRPDR